MFAVVCTTGDIRLRDGVTSYEGRVEVCYNNVWGTVCQGSWTHQDAMVACRQLGLSGPRKLLGLTKLIYYSAPVLYFRHSLQNLY